MSRRNHIHRDPDFAPSYTCENLWHYTIVLERLKKSREICCAECRSVNVRQGCCFRTSTFYFKAVPELQSMILLHNMETEGPIWSARCAVLSVWFATKTVLARCRGSVCAARQACFVGFWFLAAFKPQVTVRPSFSMSWSLVGGNQAHLLTGLGSRGAQHPRPILVDTGPAAQRVPGSRGRCPSRAQENWV